MTETRMLVVDLDGTLVRSDLLFETFWSAFSRNWRAPFLAARALSGGRAALKSQLSQSGDLDVGTLPYNARVLEFIADWRRRGGQTALVTASNEALAQRVAAHLGVFDEVHGSDAVTNLKGERKARFLGARYGDGNFDYIGDARADLPVWDRAGRAILVDVPQAVRGRITAGREIVELSAEMMAWRPWLRVMRPHQWLKNLLVFLPLLAAHQLDLVSLQLALLAFLAFSLTASSVYVLNDLLDIAADRKHPRKCRRPFASGDLPLIHGSWLAPALLIVGLATAALVRPEFVLVLVGYYAATMAYSLVLKRQAIIDIVMLAGLYTARIIAGAVATGIELSVWLLAFSTFLFFALAAVKRQAELVDLVARGLDRVAGRGYSARDLPLVTAMATAAGYVAILVLAQYVSSPDVAELYARPPMLWGICLVLFFWINRIVMLTHRGEMHDDPVVFAATDRISLICFLLCLCCAVAGTF